MIDGTRTARRVLPYGLLAAMLVFFSGCAVAPARSNDDYRSVFADVIRKSFAENKANNVCLPSIFGFGESAPDFVELNLENEGRLTSPAGRLAQLSALESVGLVARADSERTVGTRTVKFATFRRTATGAAFYSNGTFCYARAELDSVVKWKGPIVIGEYRAAWVYYTTKTTTLASWASAPAVVAAFPSIGPLVRGEAPKTRQVAIDYSSEGWDVAEYSKLLQLQ